MTIYFVEDFDMCCVRSAILTPSTQAARVRATRGMGPSPTATPGGGARGGAAPAGAATAGGGGGARAAGGGGQAAGGGGGRGEAAEARGAPREAGGGPQRSPPTTNGNWLVPESARVLGVGRTLSAYPPFPSKVSPYQLILSCRKLCHKHLR